VLLLALFVGLVVGVIAARRKRRRTAVSAVVSVDGPFVLPSRQRDPEDGSLS
jgi:ABC-type proline/glycine betaine transport system permease subunit